MDCRVKPGNDGLQFWRPDSGQPALQVRAHKGIVVEVGIGRADAVDLLLLSASQRLARVETPDAFEQSLPASKIAALQSVTWASSAKSSADTSFLATAAWMRSNSSTARLAHTLQWPSSPPLMRTVRSRPFATTVKGVTRSRMM